MKRILMLAVVAIMVASLLSIPASGSAVSAKEMDVPLTITEGGKCPEDIVTQAKDKSFTQAEAGFHWQLESELSPEISGTVLDVMPLLNANGVNAAITDNHLTMNGQNSIDQLRAALFDTPQFDLLGESVDMTIYLPADGTPIALNLETRITTGYIWEMIPEEGGLYAQQINKDGNVFSTRYPGYGAPSLQTIHLNSTGTGDTSLHLVYRRPFEPDAPAHTQLKIWMPVASNVDLSDPTPTELQAPTNTISSSSADAEPSALAELLPKAIPASWDWRAKGIVTPIRDQGGCGSCWAFGTVGAMEAAVAKSGGGLTDLSEQYLVSCNLDGWSCNGGWDTHEYHYNVPGRNQTQAGAVLESAKPYTATNGTCNTALNHPYKLTGWGYVGGLNAGNYWYTVPTYAQLKNAIYTYGPITTGVCAGSSFSYYTGGLFTTNEASNCGSSPNHLIVLVGWNDADQSLILRNSWGSWWGENGYMRIKYGTSMVGIAPTWVTRTSSKPVPTLYQPSGTTSATKPAYIWSKTSSTTSYKVQVYDIASATYRINTTVSSSYCNAATNRCSYTPNVLLTNNKNYKWRVAAGSGSWSAFKSFAVKPTSGFNSQFTSNASGWSRVYGSWALASSNYYKTAGVPNYFSSAKHTNNYSNFTYEARLKRTGSDTHYSNGLFIRGNPSQFDVYKIWRPSYSFFYTNNGYFSVWKTNSAGTNTALKSWTSHTAIASNNWNTLKVVAVGSLLKFYINGYLVWYGRDATLATGQLGFGMYRDTFSTGNTLYVDWAKVSTTTAASLPSNETIMPGTEVGGGTQYQSP